MEIGCCDSRSVEMGGDYFAAVESPVSCSANGPTEPENEGCEDKSPGSGSANATAGKNGRNGRAKMGHLLRNSVNKPASQIRKPPHRRSASPLNWFPRRKTDSFLKRKIKLLQETEGMNSSLDETLGNANPHYTRIAREKIAARAAANKAMEARKAAMIEASWCRIFRAARIHSKEAEDTLEKAEKCVIEAFEAAASMGVMMYDRPDCPRRSCEIVTSSVTGGPSTHKVTASFETAFEVDKEVAAAVKKAFIRLANCPSSSNKEEFRDLLQKISQNPDIAKMDQAPDVSLQNESVSGSEMEPELPTADFSSNGTINECERGMKQINSNRLLASDSHRSFQSSQDLVDMMFDRLKCLPEDEVASLAVIVATCGLNAALHEMENRKSSSCFIEGTLSPAVTLPSSSKLSTGVGARRLSSVSSFIHGHIKGKEPTTELPSLDKLLVKHVTRLEKEVQEAKNSKKLSGVGESVKQEFEKQISEKGWAYSDSKSGISKTIPDLGSILVKHVSSLERAIHAAKTSTKNNALVENGECTGPSSVQCSESEPYSHVNAETEESNMEKQSEETSSQRKYLQCGLPRHSEKTSARLDETESIPFSDSKDSDKENMNFNELPSMSGEKESKGTAAEFQKIKTQLAQAEHFAHSTVKHHISRIERAKLETLKAFSVQGQQGEDEIQEQIGLDKILIKPVHRLEREKMKALEKADNAMPRTQKYNRTKITAGESLDKILVKHVSRLEREKMAVLTKEVPPIVRKTDQQLDTCLESLDQILVKHQSKLEKAKLGAIQDRMLPVIVKEKKSQQFGTCIEGLDQILVKHQSKLEKAKLAATQDQILPATAKGKKDQLLETCAESLDQILVKHQSRLEKAKLAAAQEPTDHVKPTNTWREARKKELQEAWGGLSLGNTVKPHLSRLERDKAAWKRAEEEELRRAREV